MKAELSYFFLFPQEPIKISNSSRPPSVRVDHGYSILVVCLAGASVTMTVKTD